MSGPWEKYQGQASDGPWTKYQQPAKPNKAKDVGQSAVQGLREGVAGIADLVADASPLGTARNMLATAAGLAQLQGGKGKPNVTAAPASDRASATRAQGYQPQTREGRYARAVGMNAPNALAGGIPNSLAGLARAGANVILPGVGSEAGREVASASGGGQVAQAVGQAVGGLLGAGAASVRAVPNALARPATSQERAANVFVQRAKPNPAQMGAKAAEMRAAGVEPTLADFGGNRARRLVRAVGVKSDMAGEALEANARKVTASTKPAIMERTRNVGPMRGKTADQLVDELFKARDDAANTNYRDAYATPVKVDENILRALSDEPGKAALRRARSAAVARMDEQRVREIDSILNADAGPAEIAAYHGSPTKGLTGLEPRRQEGTFDFPPVVSLSTDKNFAARYAGDGGQVYPAAVSPKNVGDFRKPEDVKAVIDFYERQHGPLSADDVNAIRHGSWRLWENADLWKERGWRGSFAREEPGTTNANALNISLASGDDVRLGGTPRPHTPPPQQVSAATLDRARIAMRERAKTAGQRNARDLASGLNKRVDMIDQTLEQVPELGPARADYRNKSQAIGVLGKDRADVFSTDPNTYGQWLSRLSPEAQQANQVAIRQEVLDTLGGQRSATFGTVDELATSEYARANLKQALGDEAEPYIAFLNAKLEQMRNAQMVNPNAGSRTAVLDQDVSGLMKAADATQTGAQALMGDKTAWAKIGQWLLSRGVSEADAQALAQAAIDPAQSAQVLRLIEQRMGRGQAQQFLQLKNAALVGALSVAGAQPASAEPQ